MLLSHNCVAEDVTLPLAEWSQMFYRNVICSSSEVKLAFLLDCMTLEDESTAVLQNSWNR
jgi:hypothetical protein